MKGYRSAYAVVLTAVVFAASLTTIVAVDGKSAPEDEVAAATSTPAPTAVPVSTITPGPLVRAIEQGDEVEPATVPGLDDLDILPLSALSPEAALFADSLDCCFFSAAIVIPEEGRAYVWGADKRYPLLSVVKVPIMLTFLDQVSEEGRDLTPLELELLGIMIDLSDNDATDVLWEKIGWSDDMLAFLESAGYDNFWAHDDSWGQTLGSPLDMATLMAALISGDLLDDEMTDLAMSLLANVVDYQDWGALAATDLDAETGVKNGWYPEWNGYWFNSLGYVIPEDGPAYTLAIFTQGWRYYTGINVIEGFATMVNQAMAAR